MSLIQLAEKRWLPDSVIRFGMRRLLRERLAQDYISKMRKIREEIAGMRYGIGGFYKFYPDETGLRQPTKYGLHRN